jgi:hypothetical protein
MCNPSASLQLSEAIERRDKALEEFRGQVQLVESSLQTSKELDGGLSPTSMSLALARRERVMCFSKALEAAEDQLIAVVAEYESSCAESDQDTADGRTLVLAHVERDAESANEFFTEEEVTLEDILAGHVDTVVRANGEGAASFMIRVKRRLIVVLAIESDLKAELAAMAQKVKEFAETVQGVELQRLRRKRLRFDVAYIILSCTYSRCATRTE